MSTGRSVKRFVRGLGMRVAALVGGTREAIQWTGKDNDPEKTVGYLSFAGMRRDHRFPGPLPGHRFRVAQNFLDESFATFPGPKLFFSSEPPTALNEATRRLLDAPGVKTFTYLYGEPDVERRMFYPALRRIRPALLARLEAGVTQERPGLCCVVNRWHDGAEYALAAERVRFARAMGDDIDIYGAEPWQGENGWRAFPRYRGAVADKGRTVARYTFLLAFENSDHFGYITEKVMDALVAGAIPLYWGGGGALETSIPADCVIDCRDQDPTEIHRRIRRMPHAEVVAYRRAGLRFLASPAARRFTREDFVDRIIERLQAGRLV